MITYRWQLEGDKLISTTKFVQPDGKSVEIGVATNMRVSGGRGFLGKWRSTEVKVLAPTMKITLYGNTVVMNFIEPQAVCNAKLDGKDYPVTIGGAITKQTWSFERTGPLSFKVTTKLSGKAVGVDIMTLAADGKTMVDDGNGVTVNEPTRAIYERSK